MSLINNKKGLIEINTIKKAVYSLISGILLLLFLFLFPPAGLIFLVIGLIFGITALKEIKIKKITERKQAIAGITCSIAAIGIIVIGTIIYIAWISPFFTG